MKKFISLSILLILSSFKIYTHNLVDVTQIIPDVILDIKYATADNFTGQPVYNSAKCFLVKEVAEALKEAADEARALGYRFKIWDGYRPRDIQYKFWDLVKDKYKDPENYVADPSKGSRHNRAAAVDLTLVDKDGNELDMGTPFDEFSTKAHRGFKKFSKKVRANRQMFESIMTKNGKFVGLPTEWWHYDYANHENFPILNISFEEIEANCPVQDNMVPTMANNVTTEEVVVSTPVLESVKLDSADQQVEESNQNNSHPEASEVK